MSHVSGNEYKGEGLIHSNRASLYRGNEFASETSICGRVTVILTKHWYQHFLANHVVLSHPSKSLSTYNSWSHLYHSHFT